MRTLVLLSLFLVACGSATEDFDGDYPDAGFYKTGTKEPIGCYSNGSRYADATGSISFYRQRGQSYADEVVGEFSFCDGTFNGFLSAGHFLNNHLDIDIAGFKVSAQWSGQSVFGSASGNHYKPGDVEFLALREGAGGGKSLPPCFKTSDNCGP